MTKTFLTKLTKQIRIGALILLSAMVLLSCTGMENENKQAVPKYKVSYIDGYTADEYYNNGNSTDFVIGIDEFGRTFGETLGEKEDKQRDVGIFYFLTLGQHGADDIYDASKILAEPDGVHKMFHSSSPEAPEGGIFFWGEPLYGYYNSSDAWVIRRHLELLTEAGVDFLVFDTTNAFTYDNVVQKIVKSVVKLREEGFDCPQLAYYSNSYSHRVIQSVYENFYKNENYAEAWYRIDGKPLIIGNITVGDDKAEAWGRGDMDYKSFELSDEIKEFFSFRASQWPFAPFLDNGFPWMEWTYPAPVHGDVINVAVAAHPALPMSFSITRGAKNWGRGYNVKTQTNEAAGVMKGQYFQSCWDVALEEDPPIVFVTGWNEWVAGKNTYDGEYAMVDLANLEFSRDAEIMKGGYNDAFYIQLASNIRKYKSVNAKPGQQFRHENVTIDIEGDFAQWDGVKAVFKAPVLENKPRKSFGAAQTVRYETPAARNYIKEMRVTSDEGYFYFFVETEDDITAREAGDTGFMNLFIGKGALALKGFNGYEFVIGRQEKDGRLSVEKLSSDYSGKNAGEADFRIVGNKMMIRVARSVLGIAAGDNNLYFKMADGIEKADDIMDYYVSGKSFPVGRLSFRYLG